MSKKEEAPIVVTGKPVPPPAIPDVVKETKPVFDRGVVFVGRQPPVAYAGSIASKLQNGKPVTVKARGKNIGSAIVACEIARARSPSVYSSIKPDSTYNKETKKKVAEITIVMAPTSKA